MINKKYLLCLSTLISGFSYANTPNFAEQCQNLSHLQLWNTQITSTSVTQDDNGKNVCLVQASSEKRQGVGQNYEIKIEMRLPEHWNHNFLFQGGGGMDGIVRPAVGKLYPKDSTAPNALSRGYAVVSTDSGHQKPDASFGQDQQAKLDYAYASIGKVTVIAKQIIQKFYAAAPDKSFFMGCSNGGRSALQAAIRYPTEFDAVLALNPGLRLSRAAIAQTWDVQQLMKIAPKVNQTPILANALTQKDLDIVQHAILKKCDALDGIKDGIINNQAACHFDIHQVQCKAGDTGENCLAPAKVHALDQIFKGVKDSKGNALYNSWPYDAGINAAGWREWKLGTSQDATSNALNVKYGNDSLPRYFMNQKDSTQFNQLHYNFDHALEQVNETARINDVDAVDFSTFSQRGGKLIIIHGTSDPVFSAQDTVDWYKKVQSYNPENFSRLFLVPGMNHCGGGNALNDMDALSTLENWVKTQQAPESIAATGKYLPDTTQPICAYPKQAFYQQGKDPKQLSSYTCK